jgi:predicted nucleic acid-binding protein
MPVLPDTSVWVDFFRNRHPAAEQLDERLGAEEVVTCGPIVAELLAGVRPGQREGLLLALSPLRFVELGHAHWRLAGERVADLRATGETLPLLDVLIAVAAHAARARIWTRDADLTRLSTILPGLEVELT